MFAILLDAVFQPLHKIGQLTSHHLNIDRSHFISLSNSLLMCEFRERLHKITHTPIRKNLKCSNQVILGVMGCPLNEKYHFLRTYASYANMQYSTVHYFIQLLKWHKIPRKIIGFLPLSLWPLQANWYLFKKHQVP